MPKKPTKPPAPGDPLARVPAELRDRINGVVRAAASAGKGAATPPRAAGGKKAGQPPARPQPPSLPSDNPPDPPSPTGGEGCSRDSRDSRVAAGSGGLLGGSRQLIAQVAAHLRKYIVLPQDTAAVVAAWVAAAHLVDCWDRFPHLAITSPRERCGKTRMLQMLATVVPRPYTSPNFSAATIYRIIEAKKPSLIVDEAQALSRKGSETSEVICELLNASIDRDSAVYRCVGNHHEPKGFSVYCPKAIALIGQPDPVLADRCLPVELDRKATTDEVAPVRSRVIESEGGALRDKLAEWATANQERAKELYDTVEPLPIANDRLAELLLPLQAVLSLDGTDNLDDLPEGAEGDPLAALRRYAAALEEKEREKERASPAALILTACREIFAETKEHPRDGSFLATGELIAKLTERDEEPWGAFVRGRPITPEALANLLRPYGIKSGRNRDQSARGYCATSFAEAWARYLPPPPPTTHTEGEQEQ